MEYAEIGFCFVIGMILMLLIVGKGRLKSRGAVVILLNSLIGGGIIAILSISKLLYIPLSPLTMLICGLLGVPGGVLVLLFTLLL